MSELLRSRHGQEAAIYVSRGRARGQEWSSEDLRQLRELAGAGTSPEAIAMVLRRTASAIRNKAGMHGISLRGSR